MIKQIIIKQLTFGYQQELLFDQLCLEFCCGELTQITAGNGRGKTTLLKILANLILLESPALYINSDASNTSASSGNTPEILADYQSQVRYIGHKMGCKSGLTVRDNLLYDSLIYQQQLPENYSQWLAEWGLLPDTFVQDLSYGQQRKLALLRLVCFPGSVWLLDEPFVGLDENTCQLLANLLNKHVQNQGIVVLSSHQKITQFGLQQNIINL